MAVALAVALGGSTAGCAPGTVNLAADAMPAGTSYGKTLDHWTRTSRVNSVADMDTPVIFAATLRSRSFQRAYAERFTQIFRITTPAERDQIFERERAVTDTGLSFWLRTTFHSYQWNDLRASAAKWRLVLVDEAGTETLADAVEQVTVKEMNLPILLGQPLDPYSKLWQVRFPLLRADGQPVVPAGTKKITLRAAGPVGQTDLTWLLN